SARMATSPGTMKAAPPTIAPNGPPTRQAQKIASCVEAGPGNRLQAATASSNSCAVSQPSRSTHSSRSRAMCAGGPPKPVEPMRPHCTATSARRDGGATQLFRRGGDGSARSRAGEPGHNRSERLVLVVPECDIGDAPFLTSLDEQITALVDGPHQRDPRFERLVGADAEGRSGRFREAPPVVADGGEEVTNLELDVGEAIASGFAHPVELLRPWSRQGLAGLIGRDLAGTGRGTEPDDVGLARGEREELAASASHEDRRVRLLRRLREPVVVRDPVVLTGERERLRPPCALHDGDGFLEALDPCPGGVVRQAEGVIVDTHPPGADAGLDPSV